MSSMNIFFVFLHVVCLFFLLKKKGKGLLFINKCWGIY